MRVIVIGMSPYQSFLKLYKAKQGDYLIALDGFDEKVIPYEIDLAIGDFDTLEVPASAKKIIKYPKEKDETDFELALMAIKKLPHVEEVLVYNATGGRLDHFLINVRLLEKYYPLNIKIIDEENEISYLEKGRFAIKKAPYKYISFIVVKDSIVSLKGFKYPLETKKITRLDTYTTSNEIIDPEAIIKVDDGALILIKTK